MWVISMNGGTCPQKQHSGDAGWDCFARVGMTIDPGEVAKIPLGFAIQVVGGMEAQIRGRSGMASRGIWSHVGTIDSGYRGEVCALLINTTSEPYQIEEGDRVAQLVLCQVSSVLMEVAQLLPSDERGAAGFGSTGR